MQLCYERAIPPAEKQCRTLHLHGGQKVTVTHAGTNSPAINTAKEILTQHSVKKMMGKGKA